MIAFAKDAAGASKFLERANGKKAFDEDFEEFDEAPEFLDGNDQAVVFLAEMLFHELSGLPVHEFALGAISAALGFGGFRIDFCKGLMRIRRGFSPRRRGGVQLRRRRSVAGMLG